MDVNSLVQLGQTAGSQNVASGDLLLGLSFWGILASLLFSGIGVVYIKYGKSSSSISAVVAGIILMVYPYLVTDTLYICLAGCGIMLAHFVFSKIG
ncbi:MAG: hypothetical protein WCS77_09285 [Elusimicrobiaceae bacterium]|jgi:hypothetical protein